MEPLARVPKFVKDPSVTTIPVKKGAGGSARAVPEIRARSNHQAMIVDRRSTCVSVPVRSSRQSSELLACDVSSACRSGRLLELDIPGLTKLIGGTADGILIDETKAALVQGITVARTGAPKLMLNTGRMLLWRNARQGGKTVLGCLYSHAAKKQ